MRIGTVFPQTELGGDRGAVRAYGEALADLGFSHVLAYDHVLGADPMVHAPWTGPYDATSTFHEPFVMFGFLAAITDVELITGVIIGPQRQTALIAKQAAEVDLLTGGRFRLGLGVGWNPVEYDSLGQEFGTRGRRLSEQIGLLRELWTQPTVTFEGEFDRVVGAGIAPAPIQRPIPIWLGGRSNAAYRRIGALADGWLPQVRPGDALADALVVIRAGAVEAGRDSGAIGMEGRVTWRRGSADHVADLVEMWREHGASHLSVDTMGDGFLTVDEHLAALTEVSELCGLDR